MDDKKQFAWWMLKRRVRLVKMQLAVHERDIVGQLLADAIEMTRLITFLASRRLFPTTEIELRAVRNARRRLQRRMAG
jgi:D-arabinose 1-dehydrogenase-like Zn-dependent alcohol dehydrogenase